MDEISCGVCRDLLPLVRDGVACEESVRAVEEHIGTCEKCSAMYNEGALPVSDADRSFADLKRRIRTFSLLLLCFGIFFGLGLTEGGGIFVNIILMPVMGALGYFLFGWNSVWGIPLLIFLMRLVINIPPVIRGSGHVDLREILTWSALYAVFALAGVVIAGLLHYAFRREEH
ncbi:MAG: hypothetical protein IK115_02750 [Lachnospiraceae bacterium]|nr:hypothetical protein [Lachnospiraceae bacterium]